MSDKKRGLGRGLQDLLASSDWLKGADVQVFYCPLDQLVPNPYQPRQKVRDDAFEELAASIAQSGVIQPILVARDPDSDRYRIIAGERRWQAAQAAGLREIPVLLRDTTPAEILELALIENIQRRDLNCIEEAAAYKRLQEEFGLTQDEIARKVSKARATVANLLRLMQLPDFIQEDLLNGILTMGHARALLGLKDATRLRPVRDAVVRRSLSVRRTEALVLRENTSPEKLERPSSARSPIETALESTLGARVRFRKRGSRTTCTLSFPSTERFRSFLEKIGIPPDALPDGGPP